MALPVPSLPEMLRSGPARFLGWSGIADATVACAMARAGFDAVLLDQQHGAHDYATCRAAIAEVALAGKPSLVRIALGDFAMASRMLDAGAAGIVAPMINSVADARALVDATKFPPTGRRSWGPDRAMWLSGLTSSPDYLAGADARTLTIAMCETREALADLDAILAVPGIDGVLVGPSDLSIALTNGSGFDPTGPAVTEALGRILDAARAAGKLACAFGPSIERARELVRMGFQLVSIQTDGMLLAAAFSRALQEAGPPRAA